MFVSCIQDPDPVQIIALDEEIGITLKQKLTEVGAEPILEIFSTKEYECSNAQFDSEVILSGENKHTIVISSVIFPEECDNQDGIIIKDHELNIIAATTVVSIDIADTYSNNGLLLSTSESMSLQMATENGLYLSQIDMKLIPSGSMWGNIYSDDALEIGAMYSEMLQIFEWSELPKLKAGYYDHFTIDDNNNVELATTNSAHFRYGFAHLYLENDWELLAEKLSELIAENPSLSASIYNDKGGVINL